MKDLTIYDYAGNSLKIHDHDEDIGYFCTIPVSGLDHPGTRTEVIERSGEHGVYLASSLYAERRVQLEGVIYGDSTTSLDTRRRALEAILRYERDAYGLPQPKTIKFTTQDNVNLQFRAIINNLDMNITNINHCNFMIDFICDDYILEAQTATTQNFTSPGTGGAVKPWILPVTLEAGTGSLYTLTNNGNGEAYPTVTFTGPLTNPRMANNTTNRALGLTYSVPNGVTITINMREKTIVDSTTTNRIDKKTSVSQWWWLDPGDNDIFFSTSDDSDAGAATISYRDSYLGV